MHLAKLELQGFKTFAHKTVLLFPGPKKDNHHAITTIVGPNGSGKSNLADAIRWALGEQSLKLLRGKTSEDVIFSGSTGKARSGFAEVNLTFDNNDRAMPVDFTEVVITRRLYRNGESEYLINDSTTRLANIRLLLAEANVGQQSYSVIGQGMVDHILVATPEERKAFFDDAVGVKPLQLKRHEAILKLRRAAENLSEAKLLLQEIEPRLRGLKRQVNRLEKRSALEEELKILHRRYYGRLWWELHDQLERLRSRHKSLEARVERVNRRTNELETEITKKEIEEQGKEQKDSGLAALQKEYQEKQRQRAELRDQEFATEQQIELSKIKTETAWTPLPLVKIIKEIEGVSAMQKKLMTAMRAAETTSDINKLIDEAEKIFKHSADLVGRLRKPAAPESKTDPKMVDKREKLRAERMIVEAKLTEFEKNINDFASRQKIERNELFNLHRELRQVVEERHRLEAEWHEAQIELARLEEREKNLNREIQEELGEDALTPKANRPMDKTDTVALYPEIQRLRYQLELIGGIDPETIKEFGETNERFSFLSNQAEDLEKAIKDTRGVIDELDKKIKSQSETAFKKINKEFQCFFKILFGGGTCELTQMTVDDIKQEECLESPLFCEKKDLIIGIDIHATPPGKKIKALNLLSGGERALTSIALISAIMATNPAPFVVLDEVDAALDETNTLRFTSILEELAKLTQFIIITHNRATMEKADVLYGVTMGEEGTSRILSVQLDKFE